MLRVTEEQFNTYCKRLGSAISGASLVELKLLVPSLVHLQKQCNNTTRTWKAMSLLQDFNHALKTRG